MKREAFVRPKKARFAFRAVVPRRAESESGPCLLLGAGKLAQVFRIPPYNKRRRPRDDLSTSKKTFLKVGPYLVLVREASPRPRRACAAAPSASAPPLPRSCRTPTRRQPPTPHSHSAGGLLPPRPSGGRRGGRCRCDGWDGDWAMAMVNTNIRHY